VSSGASSGSREVRFERFDFAAIGFPHRDNASRVPAGRPDQNYDPTVETTRRDETALSLVTPIVLTSQVQLGKNLRRTAKIQTSLLQGFQSLQAVEGNSHRFIVVIFIL
jgi:hypothetical protein